VHELILYLSKYREKNPLADKEELAKAAEKAFGLELQRKVYVGEEYAVRFSSCSGASFSNSVLSLSALRIHDDRPLIVCLVRPDEISFLLANTTFLKKISHSSHQLRVDNIRGTFLGHDIIRLYEGIENTPENFDRLWALHQGFTWDENLARLVEATTCISPTGVRYEPSAEGIKAILAAPILASRISGNRAYLDLKMELTNTVVAKRKEILQVAAIDNVNIRGNRIEQVITGGRNVHGLGDWARCLPGGIEIQLEIKTKLLDRSSSPKAYNIDKALELLARGKSLIAFCFVGIDSANSIVRVNTLSIFDKTILDSTRIQFHWAGRNSRGVTQLTGDLNNVFSDDYRESIAVDESIAFLRKLIELKA